MENARELLHKSPSKLKMVECRNLLGLSESEWVQVGAKVRHEC